MFHVMVFVTTDHETWHITTDRYTDCDNTRCGQTVTRPRTLVALDVKRYGIEASLDRYSWPSRANLCAACHKTCT